MNTQPQYDYLYDADEASNRACLIGLNELARDWDLVTLIESMQPDDQAHVLSLLREQAAQQMVAS